MRDWGGAEREMTKGTDVTGVTERTWTAGVVGRIVVFCEDTRAVVGAEDYNGIDGEEGHSWCHDCGVVGCCGGKIRNWGALWF